MGTPSSWNYWESAYNHWTIDGAWTQGCRQQHNVLQPMAPQESRAVSMSSDSNTADTGTRLLKYAAAPSALALLALAGARATRRSWQNRRRLGHCRPSQLANCTNKPASHQLPTGIAATLDEVAPHSDSGPPYGHPIDEQSPASTTDQWTQTTTQHAAIAALAAPQQPPTPEKSKSCRGMPPLKPSTRHAAKATTPKLQHRSSEHPVVDGNAYLPLNQRHSAEAVLRTPTDTARAAQHVTCRSTEPPAAGRPPMGLHSSTTLQTARSASKRSAESAQVQRHSQLQNDTSNTSSLSRSFTRMSSLGTEIELAQVKEENLTLSQALFSKEVEVLQLQQRIATLESHCSALEKALLQSNLPQNSLPQLITTPPQAVEALKLSHNPLADVHIKEEASHDDFEKLGAGQVCDNPLAEMDSAPDSQASVESVGTITKARRAQSFDESDSALKGIGVGEMTVYGNLAFEGNEWQDQSDGSDWQDKSDSSECIDKAPAFVPAGLLRSLT